MSTNSIAVEQNKLSGHVAVDKHKDVVPKKKSSEKSIFILFANYLYKETLDTIKTVLIIGSCLAVYKITGLYDLWIQFVGNIT